MLDENKKTGADESGCFTESVADFEAGVKENTGGARGLISADTGLNDGVGKEKTCFSSFDSEGF